MAIRKLTSRHITDEGTKLTNFRTRFTITPVLHYNHDDIINKSEIRAESSVNRQAQEIIRVRALG
jgi:hypothetical protein